MSGASAAPLLIAILASGCVPASQEAGSAAEAAVAGATRPPVAAPPPAAPSPAPSPGRPASFTTEGELTQGGWLRGIGPGGMSALTLDGEAIGFDSAGRFFLAFDRDAGPSAVLTATLGDGRQLSQRLAVSPRAWQIEHIDAARQPGGASADFMKIRQPELDAIRAARQQQTGAQGWRQTFIWPATGRISGRFGSQRVYRGEPGAYHSGLDIATGRSGTPYVAPADGVVVLAVQGYSLEGNLLIIDHGNGLNSAFLHSSRLYVKAGDTVKQGQHMGDIGMSGRATGPHLHWSLKWHDARLDPLLFTGPMP